MARLDLQVGKSSYMQVKQIKIRQTRKGSMMREAEIETTSAQTRGCQRHGSREKTRKAFSMKAAEKNMACKHDLGLV